MPETAEQPTKRKAYRRPTAFTKETSQENLRKRWDKVKAEEYEDACFQSELKDLRKAEASQTKAKTKQNVLMAAFIESEKYVRDLFAGRPKTQQDAWRLGLLYDKITREDEPGRVNNLVINLFGGTQIGEKLSKTIEAIDTKSITYSTHPSKDAPEIISDAVEVIDNQEK